MVSKKTRCAVKKLTPYIKPLKIILLVAVTLLAFIGNYYVYQDMQLIKHQIKEAEQQK